ncbi:MAG: hypothetical protein JXK95_03100 [Bacteroidales bacterium]|nr:hypothetical protein [Bacteroidales bacterium]
MKLTATIVTKLFISALFGLAVAGCNSNRTGSHNSDAYPDQAKKVLIHYMGWYGDTVADSFHNDINRHWRYGTANTPLIGFYDSKDQSLLAYHVLLSWSCGIDGIIINVKDAYDAVCMRSLISTIQWIRGIDSTNFSYAFCISFDDQGFDLVFPYDTTFQKLSHLRDSILPVLPCYLRYNDRPAIFVFDYPDKFMTAGDFKKVADEVFGSAPPVIIWNSLDDQENSHQYVGGFYPWVQPGNKGWDKTGCNWGKEYLQWYYPRVNAINTDYQYVFTCGGVWPGFDDRKNTSWGGGRYMSRNEGTVYDSTWFFVLSYDKPLPLKWVVIETWNDWNEGTEIEPGIENGYQYLLSTIRNSNSFKGTSVDNDTLKFEAARKIYEAFRCTENGKTDGDYSQTIKKAVREFLRQDFAGSLRTAGSIVERGE